MSDSMIQSLTEGVRFNEHKTKTEEWYVGNAKRYIGMVELIMEHKKNE